MWSFSQYQQAQQQAQGTAPELVDLVGVLGKLGKGGTLRGVRAVGYVRGALERTSYFKDLVISDTTANFLEVAIFLLEDSDNTFGLSRRNFVAGEVLVLAKEAHKYVGKFVRISSPQGTAGVIRGAYSNSLAGVSVSMNMLGFKKDNSSGGWVVMPNQLELLSGEKLVEYQPIITVSSSLLEENSGIRRFRAVHPNDRVEKTLSIAGGIAGSKEGHLTPTTTTNQGTADLIRRLHLEPKIAGYGVIKEEIERLENAQRLFIENIPYDVENARLVRDYYLLTLKGIADDMDGVFSSTKKKKHYLLENVIGKLSRHYSDTQDFTSNLYVDSDYLLSQNTSVPLANDLSALFLAYIEELTGISFNLKDIPASYGKLDTAYWEYTLALISNPYMWAVENKHGVEVGDMLYFMFKPFSKGLKIYEPGNTEELYKYRDICIVGSRLFDGGTGDTVHSRATITRGTNQPTSISQGTARYGAPFRVGAWRLVEEVTSKLDRWHVVEDIYVHTQATVGRAQCKFKGVTYQSLGVAVTGGVYRLANPKGIIEYMDECGLLSIIGDDKVISTTHLVMEMEIYDRVREFASKETGISDEAIQRGIALYESAKGFSLEKEQKDAVNLLKFGLGCLSGQAGSGKTTISEVIVGVARGAGYSPVFTAPTAKAARRLEEVIGGLGPVTTMHSHFKLGLGTAGLFGKGVEHSFSGIEERCIYILDEQSMSNLDVFYQVISRISPSSIVYLLGDIKQLAPIGKGAPFRDMMEYLPAVELGVSKRAKSGSGIARNCDIINNKPTEPLVDTGDFKLLPAPDDRIVSLIEQGIANNLSQGLNPESISVVTPYSTLRRETSSVRLSNLLQPIFLPQSRVLYGFTVGDETFTVREGARVVHSGTNDPEKYKFRYDSNSRSFIPVSQGVMKGDTGKVVGLLGASELLVVTDDGSSVPDIYTYSKRGYYIVVEYYDNQEKENLYALYQANKTSAGYSESTGQVLMGGELRDIELAYAMTVFKFQGSQTDLVVIPITSKDSPEFVNRNLIYTAISRAQQRCVIVGSVQGTASTVVRGRGIVATQGIETALSYFQKEFGFEDE